MTAAAELAAAAKAALLLASLMTCDASPLPEVRILMEASPITVTHELSHDDLGRFEPSTRIAQHAHETFVTGGITESNIETLFDLSFRKTTNTYSRESCLAVNSISVTVSYAPTVHIARNFPEGSCRYNQTWLHELRHVSTDILTIKEFLPFYRKALETIAATFRNEGPLTEDETAAAQEKFGAQIKDAVTWAGEQMDKARLQRQRLIDTREEYLRLSEACPGP